ncbi:PCTP-like protein [Stegastes partitus]|uniref:PCTP-like protein n=1 Tax=Stegastes partitus TaxID=144197 RepID=A0A9Y4TTB3_9TELE|nr:PREDICTED: PCTP-like protein [Stegastes partitus]
MPVQIPDDSDFSSFKDQCLSADGWTSRYNKGGVTVWCRDQESSTVQKLKMRIVCKDVMAETLYDVLHDTSYRKKWDTNMIDTYDIGRLTVNADVGYYSCPQHPPKKDYVRAVSLLTGYLIQSNGTAGSTLYYLTQVDPRGSLPKWVVNRVSQFVAPKAMRKIYKASLKYPEWKRKHNPSLKPWMFPEQNTLPCISVAELTLQRGDSLENIDESGVSEEKTNHSDDEET